MFINESILVQVYHLIGRHVYYRIMVQVYHLTERHVYYRVTVQVNI